MNWITPLAAFGMAALLVGQAEAITLTNEDDVTHEIVVVTGQGDGGEEKIALDPGQSNDGLCNEGCALRLSDGTENEFAGNEIVSIKDGEFVVAE